MNVYEEKDEQLEEFRYQYRDCLLYTSGAADELFRV